MVRFKNPNNLLRMVVRFIARESNLTQASMLVYESSKQRYSFIDSKGKDRIPIHLVRIDLDHPLILWFLEKKDKLQILEGYFCLKKLKSFNRVKHSELSPQDLKEIEKIKELMISLNASLCIPCFYHEELLGILILGNKKTGEDFLEEEIQFFETLANDSAMTIKNAETQTELVKRNAELEEKLKENKVLRDKEQQTYYEIMLSLAQEVRMKDSSTFGHLEAVEKLGIMTAEELGLDLSGKKRVVLSASLRLHDVGKIGIPDSVLKKEGSLNEEEWSIMKEHVDKGVKILEPLTDFKEVSDIIRCHHENYDGSGYPRGIKGDEIPIESSIISVVDAFHAMISSRCYKKGFPLDFAINELETNKGKQFHPKVVDAFLNAFKKNMFAYYDSRIKKEIKSQNKPQDKIQS